eukprot:1427070-Pyramimonas_sp.AAC.1
MGVGAQAVVLGGHAFGKYPAPEVRGATSVRATDAGRSLRTLFFRTVRLQTRVSASSIEVPAHFPWWSGEQHRPLDLVLYDYYGHDSFTTGSGYGSTIMTVGRARMELINPSAGAGDIT